MIDDLSSDDLCSLVSEHSRARCADCGTRERRAAGRSGLTLDPGGSFGLASVVTPEKAENA